MWAWDDPLPQWLVDGATGFGDGVYSGITFGLGDLQDVRDLMGIDGGVDRCSKTYRFAHIAGTIEDGAALGGSLAAKSFVPGGWTNAKTRPAGSFTYKLLVPPSVRLVSFGDDRVVIWERPGTR